MLQQIQRNNSLAELLHPEGGDVSTNTLPEYVEAHEVEALISRAPGHTARLLFMIQWGQVFESPRPWPWNGRT